MHRDAGVYKKQGARGKIPILLYNALKQFSLAHGVRVIITRGGFTSYGPPGHANKGAVDIRLPSRDGYSGIVDTKLILFLNNLPSVRAVRVDSGTAPHIHVEVAFIPVG